MAETLGPYEIRGELGRGAMAVVWRAYDKNVDREVALKEPLIPTGIDSVTAAEMGARFVREGKAAGRLNHPGIVTIYNADIYNGRAAIAMELLSGRTLAEVIDTGRVDPGVATAIIDQLLDAVGFAHAHGVVHRDIKPDNIFITDDGRVKLTDFGIASVSAGGTLTQAGQVLGTPGYMAPEQVVGSAVDSRADIFAIGVIAYELFTGRNPFGATDGSPPTTILYRVVHEEPPAPAALSPDVPVIATSVIQRAMAKDPAARYQSAEEMRADLRSGSFTPAQPVPGGLPVGPFAGNGNRNLLIAAGGAVAVVAVVMFFVFGSKPMVTTVATSNVSAPASTTPVPPPTPAPVVDTGPSEAELKKQAESDAASAFRDWLSAWGSMNLNAYLGYYAPDFHAYYKGANGASLSAWRAYKTDIFAKYSYQKISYTGMQIRAESTERVRMEFMQSFESDSLRGGAPYSDYGRKIMTWTKQSDGRWLISQEEWYKQ